MRWLILAVLVAGTPAFARDWHVASGGTGDGSAGAPFGSVQTALDSAMPGDVVVIAAGTYAESLQTQRAGSMGATITIRGTDAVVTVVGRVLTVSHPHHVFEGVTFDGQYGDDDAVRIETAGEATVLRGCEVRRAQRDCIDMGAPANVVIDGCSIHHCLNATGGRTDAHGIVGGAVRDLLIRNTEIHTFSGDAVQFDPGRAAPGWDRITIDSCTFWLEPLPAPENGFPAGTVPGENAIDTKVIAGTNPSLTIINTVAYGFRGGLLTNMAAFNLKESVVARLDRVTIYDSEIGLRLRFPANVEVSNAVIYDVDAAVRYEDDIVGPRLFSSTIGGRVTNAFVEASSDATVFDGRNVLVLASALPQELAGQGSLAVDASAFVDAAGDDYHLVAGSPAIDRGIDVDVMTDRDGFVRPQGASHDVGAHEFCESECVLPSDAGPGGGEEPVAGAGCCDAGQPSNAWVGFLVLVIVLGRSGSRGRGCA